MQFGTRDREAPERGGASRFGRKQEACRTVCKRAGEYRMTEMERIVKMRRAGMESKVVRGDGLAIVKRVVDSALGSARNFEDSIAIGSAAWFCSTSHAIQHACASKIFVHVNGCVQKLLQHSLDHAHASARRQSGYCCRRTTQRDCPAHSFGSMHDISGTSRNLSAASFSCRTL